MFQGDGMMNIFNKINSKVQEKMKEHHLSPNQSGYYGDYGGKFIPEILTTTFDELIEAFQKAKQDT